MKDLRTSLFLCGLPPLTPHRPWGPNNFAGSNPSSLIVPEPFLANSEQTRGDLAKYADEITRLDYHIGQVEAELKKRDW